MNTTSTRTEVVSTDQLRAGDVVLHEGMRMILGPVTESLRTPGVFWSYGQVQNPQDVQSDRMVWRFLHTTWWDAEGVRSEGGWTEEYSGVWTVQGNHLARWTREVR